MQNHLLFLITTEFLKAYSKVINKFTLKFAQEFCEEGEINWQKIVEFNSKKLR